MQTVGKSDIGKLRSRNEDSFSFGNFDDGVYWSVVCDGMGGATGGQIASSTTCEIISDKIKKCYNKSMGERSLENLLLSAITTANVAVYDMAKADISLSGMGTTVVACVIKDSVACIAHVGDSRAYHLNFDGITQITKDHSLVQEMLDKGQITREQFDHHPNKNIITRALGVKETIDIDFSFVNLEKNDAVLLCTDGLSGMVTDEMLYEFYNSEELEALPEAYIVAANEYGGKDNITVTVTKND